MRRAFYGNLFVLVQAWRAELTAHTYENLETSATLHKRKIDLPKTFQTNPTLMVKFSLNRVPSSQPKKFHLHIQCSICSNTSYQFFWLIDERSKYLITYKFRVITESNPSIAKVHCLISHHVNPNLFLFGFSTHIMFPSDVS